MALQGNDKYFADQSSNKELMESYKPSGLICHLPVLAQDFQVCTLVRSGNLVEVGLDVAQGLQALPVDKFPFDREIEETADFSRLFLIEINKTLTYKLQHSVVTRYFVDNLFLLLLCETHPLFQPHHSNRTS